MKILNIKLINNFGMQSDWKMKTYGIFQESIKQDQSFINLSKNY